MPVVDGIYMLEGVVSVGDNGLIVEAMRLYPLQLGGTEQPTSGRNMVDDVVNGLIANNTLTVKSPIYAVKRGGSVRVSGGFDEKGYAQREWLGCLRSVVGFEWKIKYSHLSVPHEFRWPPCVWRQSLFNSDKPREPQATFHLGQR